jgi:iron complex outermembrane receptor protein
MKKILLMACMLFMSGVMYAQSGSISGKISDADTYEALPGANVVIKGTSKGTTSDINGQFTLGDLSPGSYALEISFIGYELKELIATVKSGQTTNLGEIRIGAASIGLKEVEVIASVAIDRKTPVAVATIQGKKIEQKLGNQEFPEILRSTPSVYVTKQGGGFGDSRINIRGFDQRNTAVMINGIPVNDMENGWVYWSNWAGLSDVTSNMQVQRGLGASKLAVPAVGGTINIITNAAEMNKGGAATISLGNDGYQKYALSLSSGLSEKGWAFTLQGTHTRGNGYADGTMFRAYSYFGSIAKKFNEKHSLHLTGIGAPQWHNQREYGSFDGVTYLTVQEEGIRYNPQWGEYEGDEFSWRKNFYHKPKIFLNHYWTISDKTELSTSAYASFGRGGGTGDLGRINGSFRTSSKFRNDNGVRWSDIDSWNKGGTVPDFNATVRDDDGNVIQTLTEKEPWSNGGGFNGKYVGTAGYTRDFANGGIYTDLGEGGFIRRASMNEHDWYGLLSTLNHEINDRFSIVAGLDYRYYVGAHYRKLDNLLGLDAYFDDDDINNPEHYVTDEGNSNNKIDYNNDGLVNWLGLFLQTEYSYEKLSAFISLSGSNQGFKRIDYFLYEPAEQKSDWENFLGGTVKAGLNYNLDSRNNVFINGGYFSRQPIFDNVFVNFSNDVNEDAKNQGVFAIELGYGYRSSFFSANVNLYNTAWSDRQISRGIQVGGVDGTANFTGIDQLHQGVEVDFVMQPVRGLSINGMVSFGNWRYTDDFDAQVFDDDRQLIGEGTLFMKDVKVPDAAQTTFALGAEYELIKGLMVDLSHYYASNIYADFDVANDNSFLTPGNQAWELPGYGLLDGGVSYSWKAGKIGFRAFLNFNNLLDNEYMSESESNVLFDSDRDEFSIGTNGSPRNRVYYGFGRTWSGGLKVTF